MKLAVSPTPWVSGRHTWNSRPAIFSTYLPDGINLGTWGGHDWDIDSIDELMNLMWANPAKNSDGSARKPIDQAMIKAAKQAIVAILNSSMPGGAPLPSGITPDSIKETLENGIINDINNLADALDAYNNSGDDVALDPLLPPTGRTTPKDAKNTAAQQATFSNTPMTLKMEGGEIVD